VAAVVVAAADEEEEEEDVILVKLNTIERCTTCNKLDL